MYIYRERDRQRPRQTERQTETEREVLEREKESVVEHNIVIGKSN